MKDFLKFGIEHAAKSQQGRFDLVQPLYEVMPEVQIRNRLLVAPADLELSFQKPFQVLRTKHPDNHRLDCFGVIEPYAAVFRLLEKLLSAVR